MDISGWDVAAIFAKALTYAATLGAAGAAFFLLYGGDLLHPHQRVRIRRWIALLAAAAAIACAVRIALMCASLGGFGAMFDADFAGMILRTGEGRATAVRIAGLALLLVAMSNTRWLPVALVGAAVASTSFAWVGHIQALRPHALPTLLLTLHLLCAAFWLGALAPLLTVARDGDLEQLAWAAARFGKMALAVVAALLVAGLCLLWSLIGDAATFWSGDYGRLMAAKLCTVALLLCLAALNKVSLTPRLLRGDGRAMTIFRRSATSEMVLGGLILLITATFTTLTGPAQIP